MQKILFSLSFVIITTFSFSQCNNLFISEYIEGSGNSKAIEIYNPTAFTIPLTGTFSIRMYFNGAPTPTTFPLTGSIAPGAVHVFSTTTSDPAILAQADQTSAAAWYNGDDAVELYNTALATSVDVIGVIGSDPGTEWTVNGASGTVNKTLVRKSSIQSPNTVWTGSGEMGWDIFLLDDFTHLGSHTMLPCANPPLVVDFSHTDVCFGLAMPFTSTTTGGTGGPYFLSWNFGDGVGTSNLANPTYLYTTSGTFNVTLIATDGLGEDDTIIHQVTVFALPVACTTPTPNTGNGCAPDTVAFINCSTGNAPLTYAWTFSNGNSSTATQPTEIFNDDTAWVYLEVTDINGCVGNLSDGTDLNLPDDASFNYSANSYCVNDANQLATITGLSGGTFSCSGCTINASTGELNVNASGPGCHQITYSTNGTCPNSSLVTICISPQADATITPVAPICCDGTPITLTAAEPGGTWSGNGIVNATTGTFDCATANIGTNTITYTIAGSCGDVQTTNIDVLALDMMTINNSDTTICNDIFGFFLSATTGGNWSGTNVTDNNDGTGFFSSAAITPSTYYAVYTTNGTCPVEDSIQIDVFDYPIAAYTYTSSLGTVNFTNASTNATTWLWNFDDTNTSTSQDPTHTFALNGTYNVCLTASNAAGCESVYCENITITGLGIHENATAKFNVFPNPSNGNITIESNSTITKLSVKDLIGKTVLTKNVNGSTARITLDDVDSGIYFIEIETANGKAVKRIEVTK